MASRQLVVSSSTIAIAALLRICIWRSSNRFAIIKSIHIRDFYVYTYLSSVSKLSLSSASTGGAEGDRDDKALGAYALPEYDSAMTDHSAHTGIAQKRKWPRW
jgi:hypothetical protein